MANRPASSPARSTARVAYGALGILCLGAGLALGLLGTFGLSGAEGNQTTANRMLTMQGGLKRLSKGPARHRIVYLSDSAGVSYPKGKRVPERLQQLLERQVEASTDVRVHNLGQPGLGPYDYYFAASEIARTRPTGVVIGFSFGSLSDTFTEQFSAPIFATLLAPGQIPQALSLPVHRIGLTADQLLLYVVARQLGFADTLRWLSVRQARVVGTHAEVVKRCDEALGSDANKRLEGALKWGVLRQLVSGQARRFSAETTTLFLGLALAGEAEASPVLPMFRAALRVLSDAGIPVLVYLSPMNVEHADWLGLLDEEKLRISVDAIATLVRSEGGEFVDLHDLLPDEGFRDGPGHFTWEGVDGPLLVAEQIAPGVAKMMGVGPARR